LILIDFFFIFGVHGNQF